MGSTSTTTLVLEEATIEDFPAIRDIWFAAFTQPVIGELFPDSPGMREWVLNDWHLNDFKTRPFQKYLCVADTASRDEQGRPRLVAFGKWDLSMPEERGRRFPQWHPSSPYERCEGLIDALEKERRRVMGDEKHYYLDTVGTHPDYQRRGAGSMLVKWGCDLADRDGVSAYVDASKEGAPLYQKHGFVDYSLPGSDVASMARRKKTA
ncbi:Acyl-CoA N-acyltransferase [Penicillium occitanis (nom. inval.)]|nr:Acyl-CoA N-acyltransferase [Penicillium occitanis (nom. inval.)]PCG94748.1 hypothetical protein PENOC_081150 [Penicillium occitanis (nom. inval.)]